MTMARTHSITRPLIKGAVMAAAPALVAPALSKATQTIAKGRRVAHQATDVLGTASDMKEAVASKGSTIGKIGAIVSEVRKIGADRDHGAPKLSHLIEQHTDIAVPRTVAYDQWTQFESFAAIMKGVQSVSQDERERTQWTAKIGPSQRSWPAEIVEQVPDERIAWKSTGKPHHEGVVTFHELDRNLTRVLIQMRYDPSGPVEGVGNLLRVQRRRVKRDLRLFKHFIELRGEPTGASRQRIAKHEPGRRNGSTATRSPARR
jgi:uncharacterized membrane protein